MSAKAKALYHIFNLRNLYRSCMIINTYEVIVCDSGKSVFMLLAWFPSCPIVTQTIEIICIQHQSFSHL